MWKSPHGVPADVQASQAAVAVPTHLQARRAHSMPLALQARSVANAPPMCCELGQGQAAPLRRQFAQEHVCSREVAASRDASHDADVRAAHDLHAHGFHAVLVRPKSPPREPRAIRFLARPHPEVRQEQPRVPQLVPQLEQSEQLE
jgi:hypothetical protein